MALETAATVVRAGSKRGRPAGKRMLDEIHDSLGAIEKSNAEIASTFMRQWRSIVARRFFGLCGRYDRHWTPKQGHRGV
jgi:hypothetical protein